MLPASEPHPGTVLPWPRARREAPASALPLPDPTQPPARGARAGPRARAPNPSAEDLEEGAPATARARASAHAFAGHSQSQVITPQPPGRRGGADRAGIPRPGLGLYPPSRIPPLTTSSFPTPPPSPSIPPSMFASAEPPLGHHVPPEAQPLRRGAFPRQTLRLRPPAGGSGSWDSGPASPRTTTSTTLPDPRHHPRFPEHGPFHHPPDRAPPLCFLEHEPFRPPAPGAPPVPGPLLAARVPQEGMSPTLPPALRGQWVPALRPLAPTTHVPRLPRRLPPLQDDQAGGMGMCGRASGPPPLVSISSSTSGNGSLRTLSSPPPPPPPRGVTAAAPPGTHRIGPPQPRGHHPPLAQERQPSASPRPKPPPLPLGPPLRDLADPSSQSSLRMRPTSRVARS